MAYTKAKIEQAAQLLIKALPGLHIEVARAWVTAEQGDNNNVLGLTDANHNLYQYPTLQAGVTAAANWVLNPKSPYSGIRASLRGGSIATQANAIIRSPWNVPNSAYYRGIFTKMGLFKTVAKPPTTTTPPPTTSGDKKVSVPFAGALVVNIDPNEPGVPAYTGPFPVFSGHGTTADDPKMIAAVTAGGVTDLDTDAGLCQWKAYQYARAYFANHGWIVDDPNVAAVTYNFDAAKFKRDSIYGTYGDALMYGPNGGVPQKARDAKARECALKQLGLTTQP